MRWGKTLSYYHLMFYIEANCYDICVLTPINNITWYAFRPRNSKVVEMIPDCQIDGVAALGQLVYLVSVHVHTYMQKGHLYWERYINDCIGGTEISCFLFSTLF